MISLPPGWSGFLAVWAASYIALVILYFGLGAALVAVNRRHPERRIQQRRRSDRVRAEIRQSLVALVSVAGYVAGGLCLQANGYGLFPSADLTLLSFLGWCVVSAIAYDTWFYWGHRAMHSKALFRFHALHHRSVTPTVWANNSDSFVGTAVEQGYFLVAPLLLPIPALVLVLHKLYDQASGMVGHCGFEHVASPAARTPWPLVCTVYHDQHHSNFRCNFSNTFSLWDRIMGTLHPAYDRKVEEMEHPARERPGGGA
ncbi:sterol desaturase family protein [Stappia sp.]|jgi:Delta7-sterol 5-desaturase|uniref:sterol desaturase family protein n=1 Tax=Stappia sp. TaxID=1870903 RepID=UPI003D11B42A